MRLHGIFLRLPPPSCCPQRHAGAIRWPKTPIDSGNRSTISPFRIQDSNSPTPWRRSAHQLQPTHQEQYPPYQRGGIRRWHGPQIDLGSLQKPVRIRDSITGYADFALAAPAKRCIGLAARSSGHPYWARARILPRTHYSVRAGPGLFLPSAKMIATRTEKLALAFLPIAWIIRQESMFDPGALGPAGAIWRDRHSLRSRRLFARQTGCWLRLAQLVSSRRFRRHRPYRKERSLIRTWVAMLMTSRNDVRCHLTYFANLQKT